MQETESRVREPVGRQYAGKETHSMTLVTAKVISEQYSIPLGTIYYYKHQNKIPFKKIMGRVKFDPQEIANWIKKENLNNANEKVW